LCLPGPNVHKDFSVTSASQSAEAYVPDPRNHAVLVYVNGKFEPRSEATLSIFDSWIRRA